MIVESESVRVGGEGSISRESGGTSRALRIPRWKTAGATTYQPAGVAIGRGCGSRVHSVVWAVVGVGGLVLLRG